MPDPSRSRVTAGSLASVRRLTALVGIVVVVTAGSVSGQAVAVDRVASPTSAASETTPAGWQLVGTEGFGRLDRDRWHVYDGREMSSPQHRWRPWRARVFDGALRLTSGRDGDGRWSSGTVGGWAWDVANRRHGRVDLRIRTQRGAGATANAMMWPHQQAGLPALDAYSSPARWPGRQRVQQRTHYVDESGTVRQVASTRATDATSWRTVSVRWTEKAVTYVVDGKVTRVDSSPTLRPDAQLWPLLQTTIERDARNRLPRNGRGPTTSVDWIRVYEWSPGTPETPVDPPVDPPTDPEPPVDPEPDPEGWTSVARDDFSGTSLDTSRWSTFSGTPGCCKDTVWSGSQVEVADGELVLHNRMTPYGWRSGGVGAWKWADAVQQYGRIDARIRFDKGRGFSSAALTWPQGGGWPPELDFYEIYATRGERDMMAQSTHYKNPASSSGRGVDQKFNSGDFSRWHTVSVRWAADELTYWIDGVKVHTVRDVDKIPHTAMWIGFQTHVHKLDGAWPTMPTGQDTVAMRVDYVEVFAER